MDWEEHAGLSGLIVPKWEDYLDIKDEPTKETDSSAFQDPTPHEYCKDTAEQRLSTTEKLFGDTIQMIIKPAIKHIEQLHFRQNEDIRKKGQETLLKILTGDNLEEEV